MDRWLKIVLVVAAAFTFTIVCTFAGGSVYTRDTAAHVCALLMAPGAAIAVYWFHARVLGDTFFPLSLGFNTLIYSVLFGLLLELLLFVSGRRNSEG